MNPQEQQVLDEFKEQYIKVIKQIKESGAMPECTTDYRIAEFALIIAADRFLPHLKYTKALLKNLRHFV